MRFLKTSLRSRCVPRISYLLGGRVTQRTLFSGQLVSSIHLRSLLPQDGLYVISLRTSVPYTQR